MSVNKTKDQKGRVNTRRETKDSMDSGQQRVRVIKPADPDQKKGQRRVVRNPKGKGKK